MLSLFALSAQAREQIRIAGSSTVYPYVTATAEAFGKEGRFRTPIVEATGTGGGFKLFCSGMGDEYPDINDASRPITESERELCRANGVADVAELGIGYDGIVFANSKAAPLFHLTRRDIFLALARKVPRQGKLVMNPYTSWNQVDKLLPARPISMYGPPPTEGTRDAFVELVMQPGCAQTPEYAKLIPDAAARKNACSLLREDGRFIEAGGNYNLVIQKLEANPQALGIVGYGYLENNREKVQGSLIDGVSPTYQHIMDGSYPVARILYVYVKGGRVGKVPGLKDFLEELTSSAAIGPDGYLTQIGLLPLHAALLKETQDKVARLGGKK